jgi:hypothetical protein
MNPNQGIQQQQHKQSGGHNPFKPSPSKSRSPSRSQSHTKRRSADKPGSNHPFQNQAELQRIMSLFQ